MIPIFTPHENTNCCEENMLEFIIDNISFVFSAQIFEQFFGIFMATN